jgi:hypothetical protein
MRNVFKLCSVVSLFAVILALFPLTLHAQAVYVNANNPTTNANTAYAFKNIPTTLLTPLVGEPTNGWPSHGTAIVHTDALKDQAMYTLGSAKCLFISEPLPSTGRPNGDIAAFTINTTNGHLTLVNRFANPAGNVGTAWGIPLATGKGTLYAGYTSTNTIVGWAINGSTCALTASTSLPVTPLNGGFIDGMAESHNNITLVVSYSDGSVESFRTSATHVTAAPCATAINTTGHIDGNSAYASGVDITQDSKFAILGDGTSGNVAEVEVIELPITCSTVSIDYGGVIVASGISLGPNIDSDNVWLSPDEHYIYVTNNGPNQPQGITTVTFTEPAITGIATGCTAGFTNPTSLRSPNGGFFEPNGIQTRATTGNGTRLYVGEYANPAPAAVALLDIDSSGCTQEAAASPFTLPVAIGGVGQQVSAYPQRPF